MVLVDVTSTSLFVRLLVLRNTVVAVGSTAFLFRFVTTVVGRCDTTSTDTVKP